jgi:hypothetical protein
MLICFGTVKNWLRGAVKLKYIHTGNFKQQVIPIVDYLSDFQLEREESRMEMSALRVVFREEMTRCSHFCPVRYKYYTRSSGLLGVVKMVCTIRTSKKGFDPNCCCSNKTMYLNRSNTILVSTRTNTRAS